MGGNTDADLLNDQIYKPDGPTPSTIENLQLGLDNTYDLPAGSGVNRNITHGAGANIPSEYLGFYFSGLETPSGTSMEDYDQDSAPNVTTQQMIKVDLSRLGAAQWSNLPLSSGFHGRGGAQLPWIPVGPKGLLIAIGGIAVPYDANIYVQSSEDEPDFVSSLSVFDVDSETWYTQPTSGTPPPKTAGSCTVVAHENGTESYQIYMYGGYEGTTLSGPAYNSVWILSVPSFQWTNVTPPASEGRYGHVCVTPYPDQMLVVGGKGTYDDTRLPSGKIVEVLNLTSLQWLPSYDPSIWNEYAIPHIVKTQGDLSQKASGMDPALQTLFDQPYPIPLPQYYPYKQKSSGGNSWLAPVLGGVLGGVAVAVTGFLIWLFRRKRRAGSSQSGTSDTQVTRNGVQEWRRQVKSEASTAVMEIDSSDRSTVNTEPQEPVEIGGRTYLYAPRSPRSPVLSASPRSPQSGSVEISGDPSFRQELQDTSPRRRPVNHTPAMTEQPDYRFRNHPLFPPNINDTMSVSESAITGGHGHVSSAGADGGTTSPQSQQGATLRTEDFNQVLYGRPLPLPANQPVTPEAAHLRHHASTGRLPYENIYPGDALPSPASKERPSHPRHDSRTSSDFQITPLEIDESSPIPGMVGIAVNTAAAEDDSHAALPTTPVSHSRPGHQRNSSSQSNAIQSLNPLPSPDPAEDHRRSAYLDAMPDSPSQQPTPIRRKEVGSPVKTAYEENKMRFPNHHHDQG